MLEKIDQHSAPSAELADMPRFSLALMMLKYISGGDKPITGCNGAVAFRIDAIANVHKGYLRFLVKSIS